MKPLINWQKQTGTTIQINDVQVTPESHLLHVQLPGGGFIWHSPKAIVVEQDGRRQILPIVDITRLIVWLCLGVTLLSGWRYLRANRRNL